MSSDFRIDPSSTSTHMDYGENPDKGSRQQGEQPCNEDEQANKTYLEHHKNQQATEETRLKSRKTRKKKDKKKKRKIAERNTRPNRDDS